jgi:hypothetical protein
MPVPNDRWVDTTESYSPFSSRAPPYWLQSDLALTRQTTRKVYDNRRRTNRKKAMGKFQQLVNAIRRVEVKYEHIGKVWSTALWMLDTREKRDVEVVIKKERRAAVIAIGLVKLRRKQEARILSRIMEKWYELAQLEWED